MSEEATKVIQMENDIYHLRTLVDVLCGGFRDMPSGCDGCPAGYDDGSPCDYNRLLYQMDLLDDGVKRDYEEEGWDWDAEDWKEEE